MARARCPPVLDEGAGQLVVRCRQKVPSGWVLRALITCCRTPGRGYQSVSIAPLGGAALSSVPDKPIAALIGGFQATLRIAQPHKKDYFPYNRACLLITTAPGTLPSAYREQTVGLSGTLESFIRNKLSAYREQVASACI